ncbi:hypothetical protein LguiB_020068 [Lonicera macranthoides]
MADALTLNIGPFSISDGWPQRVARESADIMKQGVQGPDYRLISGNLREIGQITKEVELKPVVGHLREDVPILVDLLDFLTRNLKCLIYMKQVWVPDIVALYQEWLNKAREEVNRICQYNELLTINKLNNFMIVTMIVNETLRLYYPVVMMIAKENCEECQVREP